MSGRRHAFTLIELLVSIGLILTVTVIAVTATMQMLHMTRRLQALQSMDATASTLFERLSSEIASMHPCTAVWLHSDAANHSVELVFMHTVRNPANSAGLGDLRWSRWQWNSGTRILTAAVNRASRWSYVYPNHPSNYWQVANPLKMGKVEFWANAGDENYHPYYSTFVSMPQPIRSLPVPSTEAAVVGALEANRWQTGEGADFGDYSDLQRNARPMLHECTGLRLELVDRIGAGHVADGVDSLAWSAPGSHIDGRDQPDLDPRPSLLRVSFTLTEPRTATNLSRSLVSRTYSFSCPTPGTLCY